jgi:hypothetical protein
LQIFCYLYQYRYEYTYTVCRKSFRNLSPGPVQVIQSIKQNWYYVATFISSMCTKFRSVFNELRRIRGTRIDVACTDRETEEKFEQRSAVKFGVRLKKNF